MATPYTPSQLVLGNFDATQAATATWLFSSSDTTVHQQSFDLQIYNNSTGALVLDTGTVTTGSQQYAIPASTLVNRTVYKWRVMYTDSLGNASAWSAYQVFTCSSVPTVSLTNPTSNETLASNTLTLTATYSQSQNVAEQSYEFKVYANDQLTVLYDSGVVNGNANQYTLYGLSNGSYYAEVTMTSSDGLSSTTAKIPFTISYASPSQTPTIVATPDPSTASVRIDWQNPKSNPGTYVGSDATYAPGKFNQALRIAQYGEKVYWTLTPFSQFTYTNWAIANVASTSMVSSQVLAYIQQNSNNFIQVQYDPSDSTFVLEQFINGQGRTVKSQTGITFATNAQIFIALRQDTTLTGFIGVSGIFYTLSFPVYAFSASNTFGVGTFGSAKFASSVTGIVPNPSYVYIGCTPADGHEANMLFDQTHLTAQVMTDTQIQNLFTNSTLQTFTTQTYFLANFDNSLEGGDISGNAISYWKISRAYNGSSKYLGQVQNTQQLTSSFTDSTPLSETSYTYNVTPYDSSGNQGAVQSVQSEVSFDGWWLTDPTTNTSFQFLINVDDVPIKTNYARQEYATFGRYPVTAYSPVRYRTGKLSGFVISGYNGSSSAFSQYQTLQDMIDSHNQLTLRGDEGCGMVVDCYDPTNTIPKRNHKEYNKIEISWTEVASA